MNAPAADDIYQGRGVFVPPRHSLQCRRGVRCLLRAHPEAQQTQMTEQDGMDRLQQRMEERFHAVHRLARGHLL